MTPSLRCTITHDHHRPTKLLHRKRNCVIAMKIVPLVTRFAFACVDHDGDQATEWYSEKETGRAIKSVADSIPR
jgi:hypothetical protein